MIKSFSKLEIEGNCPNLTKDIYSSEAIATHIWRVCSRNDVEAEACLKNNQMLGDSMYTVLIQELSMIGKGEKW